jgi:hypothetical protein
MFEQAKKTVSSYLHRAGHLGELMADRTTRRGRIACWEIDSGVVLLRELEGQRFELVGFPGCYPVEQFGSADSLAFYLDAAGRCLD